MKIKSWDPCTEISDKIKGHGEPTLKLKTEDGEQHDYFFKQIIAALNPLIENQHFIFKNGDLIHTYRDNFLKGYKPDFTLFESNNQSNVFYTKFFIELTMESYRLISNKLKTESLDKDHEHLGKVIHYNQLIMDADKERLFCSGALTNLKSAIFIQTTRVNSRYIHTQSKIFTMEEAIEIIDYFLNENNADIELGYSLPKLNFKIDFAIKDYSVMEILGSGTSSIVFRTENNCVIKKYFTKRFYNKEKEILKRIHTNKFKSFNIIELISSNGNNMTNLLSPICKPIEKQFSIDEIDQMFESLKQLYEKDIIHNNIKPNSFVIHSSKIVLIDFCFAVHKYNKIEDVKKYQYNHYSSKHLLECEETFK